MVRGLAKRGPEVMERHCCAQGQGSVHSADVDADQHAVFSWQLPVSFVTCVQLERGPARRIGRVCVCVRVYVSACVLYVPELMSLLEAAGSRSQRHFGLDLFPGQVAACPEFLSGVLIVLSRLLGHLVPSQGGQHLLMGRARNSQAISSMATGLWACGHRRSCRNCGCRACNPQERRSTLCSCFCEGTCDRTFRFVSPTGQNGEYHRWAGGGEAGEGQGCWVGR
ncbi:unnamed protein product [Ostreobium quekettii]|uniref:Uncharacterized protein n=1 Tax=Ostreobium quekettii TaxID=121088 RepID=A0A8S1IM96_9CHLO|nr:unnamed protein product [Ostreobium quekettii]|eukprot:evm.model.scf_255EXC.5 EVM.evm.TU.scf_255EXC.5   scf_255EXC:49658-50329(-)